MKVDRLVSMIMILLDQKRIGAQELADRFEVSSRTIYRDIDAINQAGIPVCSVPGVGGGFEIMQNYKIDRKVFSAADLSAILMGLSSLATMIRGDELINALAKVRSFIPADRAEAIESKTNQICIDISPWQGNRNMQPYLEMIQNAIQGKKLLSFAYADHRGNQTARTAEPYQIVLKSTHWYCQGYCHLRNDFRLFKLSRMANLQIQDVTFLPREYPKPRLRFPEVAATAQNNIKIRIHQSVMDRVLDYCTADCFLPDGDEHYFVRFPFVESEYYYQFLFSLGDRCECLEPEPIRAEMRRRAQKLASIYQG